MKKKKKKKKILTALRGAYIANALFHSPLKAIETLPEHAFTVGCCIAQSTYSCGT